MQRLGTILFAVTLCACSAATQPNNPTPNSEPTRTPAETPATSRGQPYFISLVSQVVDNGQVQVDGTTNLPDNAIVTVFASRTFIEDGETDVRATGAAAEVGVPAADGTFSTVLILDEANLLVGIDLFPIEVLSSHLEICAEFRTGVDNSGDQRQPDSSVVDAVGPNGEALGDSPQVTVFGSATNHPANWLETKMTIPHSSTLLGQIERLQGSRPDEQELDGFCL